MICLCRILYGIDEEQEDFTKDSLYATTTHKQSVDIFKTSILILTRKFDLMILRNVKNIDINRERKISSILIW